MGLGDNEVEEVIKSTLAGEFDVGCVPDLVLLKPGDHIFVEQARCHRCCRTKEIIDGEHRLYQVVLAGCKVCSRCMHFEPISAQFHTEPVECHHQQRLSLRSIKSATGQLQILEDVSSVGENIVAVPAPGVDLEIVVVPVEIGCCDLHPLVHLPQLSLFLEPTGVFVHQALDLIDHWMPF